MKKPADITALRRVSGIYCIRSLIDDREYIGSAVSLSERCRFHERDLSLGKHVNKKLQRFHDKYGQVGLEFVVLTTCHASELLEREQAFLDTRACAFNICRIAGSTMGRRHSVATREQISRNKKGTVRNVGRKATPEQRERMRKAHTHSLIGVKRQPFKPEHRQRISATRLSKGISRGSNNSSARLTEHDVINIRAAMNAGERNINIMKQYGISKAAVSHIRVGRTWKHILGETAAPKPSERLTSPKGIM